MTVSATDHTSHNLYRVALKCAAGAVVIPALLWLLATYVPWTPIGTSIAGVFGWMAYAALTHPTAFYFSSMFFVMFGLGIDDGDAIRLFLANEEPADVRLVRWFVGAGKAIGLLSLLFLLTGLAAQGINACNKDYSRTHVLKPIARQIHAMLIAHPNMPPKDVFDGLSKDLVQASITYRNGRIDLVLERESLTDCRALVRNSEGWTLKQINGRLVSGREEIEHLCTFAADNRMELQRDITLGLGAAPKS